MFGAVVKLEWRNVRRERSLWVIIGTFAAAVLFAAIGSRQFVGAERVVSVSAASAEALRFAELRDDAHAIAADAQLRDQNANPTKPLSVGQELLPRVVRLPLAPLAPLAVGQRDILPQALTLTTRARLANATEGDTASPARRASGPFDLSFVLVFLLPLVIIATSFDLLSAERERGTLALVLSQPVSLRTFVLGKASLRAGLLAVVTVALVVAGALIAGARLAEPGAGVALLLAIGLLLAYSSFWFALSLAVNAWGRSSPANALALVGAWLALAMVVPGLASVAVDTVHPPPSRVELVNTTREAAREASGRTIAIEGDHGKPQSDDATARRAIAAQADLERQVEPVLSSFRERHAAQQALVDKLRFASPALLLHEGLSDVAGSGAVRHQHFLVQVDAFHAELKAFFHERAEVGRHLDADDYAAMPRFAYAEPAPVGVASRVFGAAFALLAMTAALLAVAFAGLRRYFSRGLR